MTPEVLFVIGVAVLGLAVGSFLNVLIHRLPLMMEADWRSQCAELEGRDAPAQASFNLWVPGSHCPSCKTPLRLTDNIPLVSWLALRGQCAHCGVAISPRYPVVELLTGLLSALVAWHFGPTWTAGFALAFTWVLIGAAFIDADTSFLPDDLTLPLMWLGILAALLGYTLPLADAVIGAMAGYLSLWSIYWLFKLATGKEGMGYGDFKLLAALGAWMGWKMLIPIALIASVVGLVFALGLRGWSKRDLPLPFGPYLCAAGFIALLWGEPVRAWLFPL
ncbi:MAG: A24 family peptidase, partial [Burkholderiaceae bacterium]